MRQRLDRGDGAERRAADSDQDEIVVATASLGGERLDFGGQRSVGGKIHPTLTTCRVLGAEARVLLGNDRCNLVEHGIGDAVRGADGGRHGIAIVDREAGRLGAAVIVHGHSSSLAGDSSPFVPMPFTEASASKAMGRTGGLAVITATRSMGMPVAWAAIAAITGTQ